MVDSPLVAVVVEPSTGEVLVGVELTVVVVGAVLVVVGGVDAPFEELIKASELVVVSVEVLHELEGTFTIIGVGVTVLNNVAAGATGVVALFVVIGAEVTGADVTGADVTGEDICGVVVLVVDTNALAKSVERLPP
jgi:hypothetical protein